MVRVNFVKYSHKVQQFRYQTIKWALNIQQTCNPKNYNQYYLIIFPFQMQMKLWDIGKRQNSKKRKKERDMWDKPI